MEELFITLQAMVAEQMPELSLVDEDYGQLQALLNGEDSYPVTFPCVLMGETKVAWKNVTPVIQQGEGSITVRLAFDCYDDTHYGSGTEDKIRERLQKEGELHKILQGYRLNKEMGRLKRATSTQFSLPGGIKVYEIVYSFTVVDN
ncbi:MAG: hypothetical protein ACRCUJ_14390 [Phocaeicola sp.]